MFVTSRPKDLFLFKKGQAKFNLYTMKFFQRALVGFNNLWIYFISREFNFVSVSKIHPSPIVQMENGELG